MNWKSLNQPLTLRSLLQLTAVVTAALVLFFGGRAIYRWMNSGFPSAAHVKRVIRHHLKKQAHRSDFQADYDLHLSEKIKSLAAKAGQLKARAGVLQTNVAALKSGLNRRKQELRTLQNQSRGGQGRLKSAERNLAERQRILASRQKASALAQTNAAQSVSNRAALEREVAALTSKEQATTNAITELHVQWAAGQSNLTVFNRQFDEQQQEAKALAKTLKLEERKLKQRQESLTNAQARLEQHPDDSRARRTLAQTQTNLVDLTVRVTALREALAGATQRATAIETNRTAWDSRMAANEKARHAKRRELSDLRKQRERRQLELARLEKQLPGMQTTASNARQRAAAALQDVERAQKDLARVKAELANQEKRQAELAAAQKAQQQEWTDRQAEYKEVTGQLASVQTQLQESQRRLARQPTVFVKEMRKKVAQANSYPALYRLIGQYLWLADQLLDTGDPAPERQALGLALEASQCAAKDAVDPWLAARICEGYVWPNLELKDAKGRPVRSPEDLLYACSKAFRDAGEPQYTIRNYRLLLQHASNERRSDTARYYLAYWLEQDNQFQEAIRLYSQIQDTNLLSRADQRRLLAQQKLQQQARN